MGEHARQQEQRVRRSWGQKVLVSLEQPPEGGRPEHGGKSRGTKDGVGAGGGCQLTRISLGFLLSGRDRPRRVSSEAV